MFDVQIPRKDTGMIDILISTGVIDCVELLMEVLSESKVYNTKNIPISAHPKHGTFSQNKKNVDSCYQALNEAFPCLSVYHISTYSALLKLAKTAYMYVRLNSSILPLLTIKRS